MPCVAVPGTKSPSPGRAGLRFSDSIGSLSRRAVPSPVRLGSVRARIDCARVSRRDHTTEWCRPAAGCSVVLASTQRDNLFVFFIANQPTHIPNGLKLLDKPGPRWLKHSASPCCPSLLAHADEIIKTVCCDERRTPYGMRPLNMTARHGRPADDACPYYALEVFGVVSVGSRRLV